MRHTLEVGYVQPFRSKWLFDFRYRFYTQTAADFYSDLFPYANAQNFLARDKELSAYTSQGIRLGVTYEIPLHLQDVSSTRGRST